MAGTFAYFQFLEKTIFNPPGCERLRYGNMRGYWLRLHYQEWTSAGHVYLPLPTITVHTPEGLQNKGFRESSASCGEGSLWFVFVQ
jgi:hypothetical protein